MWRPKNRYPTYQDYLPRVAGNPRYSGGYRRRGHSSARTDIPLVSIITVTYNAQSTLVRALESVRAQTYPNIEHIIVDGGSIDGTLDIIRAYDDVIAYWRSEQDRGIYDAFNKGVVLCSGKYVGILNADDYYEPDQIEMAVDALERTGAPFVHGNIIMHGWRGEDVQLPGDPHYVSKIQYAMPMVLHVTILCNIEVFKQGGLFHTRYRIAGDYEWLLRITKLGFYGVHDPLIRSHMQAGGVSTTNQRRTMLEGGHIVWQHGLSTYQTVCETIPRVLFPNGHHSLIPRIRERMKHPLLTARRVVQYIVEFVRAKWNTDDNKTSKRPSPLESFLHARHVCSTITPQGLDWLYTFAATSGSYAIRALRGPELFAMKIMLDGGGARQVPSTNGADIVLLDASCLKNIILSEEIATRTALIIKSNLQGFDMDSVPHLDFGGFIALGRNVSTSQGVAKGE
jgi:glycosyltransferase involved in cell wall biosynthesis